MIAKFPLKITLLLSLFWLSAQAQQTVVKASTLQSSSGTSVITNLGNATDSGDNYLSTAARMTSTYSLTSTANNNRFIEMAFTADVPANTNVYLKLESDPETKVLSGLLGGGLGGLITGLINALTYGSQTITVEAIKSDGTTAATSTTFNNEIMKVVTTATGEHFVRITATQAYRRIKITNYAGAGADTTKWLDVYGAYYVNTTASTCSTANSTSYSGGGFVSVLTTDVNLLNPVNAIDGNPATFSSLSLGTVAVNEWVEQTIYFDGPATTSDQYNIKLAIPSALLAANVIGGITINGYLGNTQTAAYTTNMGTLLGLPLYAQVLTLLNSGQPALLSLSPNVAIDRIVIRFTALVSVSTTSNVSIYEVSKGFGLNVTGGGTTFHVNDTVTLTANLTNTQCNESFTYSWVATGTTTPVLGTGATYAPSTSTPGTYNYTVTVTDNYGVVKTATAQVVVQAPPVGGTVASQVLECTYTPTANLTLSGQTGNVVRWEKASDSGFTTPVTIASTNTYLTPAEIGTITQTTWFRAVVTQNNYPNVNATAGSISLKTSTWNGSTWSNGTPDIGTIIYFTGNYNQAVDLTGCRIYVTNNAVVSIPTGKTVHLNKSINVQSGSFTLQNDAHLLQDTATEANTGNITVTRDGSALYRLDYTFWSSPVTGTQTLTQFSPLTATSPMRFYTYDLNPEDNTMEMYVPMTSPSTTTFSTAKGYLVRMPNNLPDVTGYNAGTNTTIFTGFFNGVPNNGTITRPLNTQAKHYTGIGNPYPSPINVHDFLTTNESVLQSGSAIYFWRKKNNSEASSYATLTWDVYTYNHAIGGNPGEDQYGGMQWDSYFNTSNPANWVINTGQAFLVKTKTTLTAANNPQITFNAAMRRGNVHDNQFFKTAQNQDEENKSRIWINLQGTDAIAQAAVVYSSTATNDIDYGRDAVLINPDGSALWSTLADNDLVVQAKPQFTDADVVPMGYKAITAGQYSIVVHRADGIFAQGQDIFLKDNMLGTVTSIKETPYTFSTEAGSFESRFEIVYIAQGALGTNPETLSNMVMVYQNNGAINISTGTAVMNTVTIYDVRGRKLYEQNGINATETSISNLGAAQQMLIVEIDTVEGKVSRKIVY